ncbi:DUF58 domain-containing protein [Gilvimarinus xylanilyticus]|uniref:DUF58 domain-containing protein n=1 Tax=Gilvimarinus xylanilyticus TaxID=2944139 RepID=A0A9X2KTV1_9GAMM|nr:DUF58 domain-containing protein [Gilvimarinus xylanilyticus]MCP8899577.1 DUF58 domain-containing protein [Gilvimarinus xylanilyticus]
MKPTGNDAAGSHDSRIYTDFVHLKGLQRRARKLNFLPRHNSKSILSGRHGSRMRGRGLSFEELRDYRVGDDIRTIDWRVTARTGKPHVRVYAEEKDRSALLIVDQRMSMFFGSTHNMKSVTASEAAALCAYGIFERGDRVGAVLFNDEQVHAYKPSKRARSLEQIVRALADCNLALNCDLPVSQPMHLNLPLKTAAECAGHDQLIIVISDFDEVDEQTEVYLGELCAHNDVVLVQVVDPMARELPADMQMVVSDGRLQMTLDTSQRQTHAKLQASFSERVEKIGHWRERMKLSVMELSTAEDTFMQMAEALAVRR